MFILIFFRLLHIFDTRAIVVRKRSKLINSNSIVTKGQKVIHKCRNLRDFAIHQEQSETIAGNGSWKIENFLGRNKRIKVKTRIKTC